MHRSSAVCIYPAKLHLTRCRGAPPEASLRAVVLPLGLVPRFCASPPKTIFRVQPAMPRLVSLAACETPPAPAKPRSSLAAHPVPPLAAHPYGSGFPPAPRLQCAPALAYNSRRPLETKAPPAHRAGLVCGVVDAPGLVGVLSPLSRGPYFISIPTSLGLRTTSFGSIFAMWSSAAVPSP